MTVHVKSISGKWLCPLERSWFVIYDPNKWHNYIFSQTDLAHTLIGFVGPILLTPQMFGIPEGVDMVGFIHYWKVLGYLHGIKDDFNPFRNIFLICSLSCVFMVTDLAKLKSDDLVLTRATIAEVSASCLVPKLHSPPPMFDKMSQVRTAKERYWTKRFHFE